MQNLYATAWKEMDTMKEAKSAAERKKFMNKDYLDKLARLAVEGGVNVQKGQPVVIRADVEAREIARLAAKHAYEKGASKVTVLYSDEPITRMEYLQADPKTFETAPAWKAALNNDSAAEDAAYIHIVSDDPDLLKGVDPRLPVMASKAMHDASSVYRNRLDSGQNAWTIIAAASPAWAARVYPGMPEEKAVDALWKDIFAVSRIDENDPLENWKQHDASFQSRLEKLNSADLQFLHYTSSNGTDLMVELPEGYIFEGGSSCLQNGRRILCNIPTEEVFTAPKKDGVNGTLKAVMPLNLDGTLVDDFSFVFKDGKVVDFDAAQGKEALEQKLNADEGARYLGEAALVPYDSPIRKLGRIFYNTLLDENAACHFALGQSYAETLKDGLSMSKEELEAHGMNHSAIHVDFMVGAKDLNIEGIDRNGRKIPVFENGNFAAWLS